MSLRRHFSCNMVINDTLPEGCQRTASQERFAWLFLHPPKSQLHLSAFQAICMRVKSHACPWWSSKPWRSSRLSTGWSTSALGFCYAAWWAVFHSPGRKTSCAFALAWWVFADRLIMCFSEGQNSWCEDVFFWTFRSDVVYFAKNLKHDLGVLMQKNWIIFLSTSRYIFPEIKKCMI